MADFARWVMAAEPALDLDSGSFVAAYKENRAGAVQLTLDASPLSAPVLELACRGGFEGTARNSSQLLNGLVTEDVRKQREWPKQANILSNRLRRLAPALRRVGVFVEFSRDSQSRSLTIGARLQNIVTSVTDRHRGDVVTSDDDDDDVSQVSTNPRPVRRGEMSEFRLTQSDYRFLAELPAEERRFVLELMRELDAHVDDRDASHAFFLAELVGEPGSVT